MNKALFDFEEWEIIAGTVRGGFIRYILQGVVHVD
ncbi:hypothetical protein PF003_g19640 [Phytophthora fragariae]|nr:hypothetical protein PF003_g19640 [Phytophthora fragariae]